MQPGTGINRDGLMTEDPVGTLQEVEKLGLPQQLVKTCSMPDGERNLGCRHYLRCQVANSGERPYKGVSGPHNHGVYRISGTSGRSFVKIFPCYRFLDHVEEWRQNGDRVAICGDEGDVVPLSGTMEKKIGTDHKTGRAIMGPRPIRPGVVIPRHPRPRARFPHALLDAELQGLIQRRMGADDMAAIAAGEAFVPGMPGSLGGLPNRIQPSHIPLEGDAAAQGQDLAPKDVPAGTVSGLKEEAPVVLMDTTTEEPDPERPLSFDIEEEPPGEPLNYEQP